MQQRLGGGVFYCGSVNGKNGGGQRGDWPLGIVVAEEEKEADRV